MHFKIWFEAEYISMKSYIENINLKFSWFYLVFKLRTNMKETKYKNRLIFIYTLLGCLDVCLFVCIH